MGQLKLDILRYLLTFCFLFGFLPLSQAQHESILPAFPILDTMSANSVLSEVEIQLYRHEHPDSAEWWLIQLLEKIDTVSANALRARYLMEYGNIRYVQQQMPEAIMYYKKAQRVFEAVGDSSNHYFALSYRKSAEMRTLNRYNFNEAVTDYKKAIALFEYQRDTVDYLRTLQTLSQLFGNYGFYELAEKERAIIFHYAKGHKYDRLLSVVHMVAAIDKEKQGFHQEMLSELNKASVLLAKLPRSVSLTYFLNRIYVMRYYYAENRDSLNYYYQRTIEKKAELINNQRLMDNFERDEGIWHYINGRYAAAEKTAQRSLAKARQRSERGDIIVNLELLKKIYTGWNRHEAALTYAGLESDLRDSIHQEARLTQSVYYENLYEKEKSAIRQAEQEKVILKIKQRNQVRIRNYLTLGVSFIILLFLTYGIRSYWLAEKQRKMQTKFSQDLMKARSIDRKRIARELHDRIGHELLLVKNDLMGLSIQEVRPISNQVTGLMSQVRNISHELHDPGPEELGFVLAVKEMVDRFDKHYSLFFQLDLPDQDIVLPLEVLAQLFLIIQESLKNTVTHAQAKAVKVSVWLDQRQLNVRIIDNGIGFDPVAESGVGLKSIQERSTMIGARIRMKSQIGKGTEVFLQLNLKHANS